MNELYGPELVFVMSAGGFKFCKLKVEGECILLVFKKPKSGDDPYSREVEIELMEFIFAVWLAAVEYCRRTNQNLPSCYQELTYRA